MARRRENGRRRKNERNRCAIYLRVSTDKQVERDSLLAQESQLLSYAQMREWTVVKVFTDAGFSAKNTKRPAYQKMLQWARDGKLDIILAARIDRVSRNLGDLLGLIDHLKTWDVEFVSASQSFDTSTPMGSLTLNILGSFAQFERDVTAERVRENMRERAKGGVWSGGQTPFGYRLNKKTKKLEIDDAEAKLVRQMYSDFLEHRSVRQVITSINAAGYRTRNGKQWSRASVRRILSSPVYIGTLRYGKRTGQRGGMRQVDEEHWIVTENAHEPIIDKPDFKEARSILERNYGRRSWTDASPHLLGGMIRCGHCGSTMSGVTNRNRKRGSVHRYYRCLGSMQKGKSFCSGCSYRADDLEKAVTGQLVGFSSDELRRELKEYKKRLKSQVTPLNRRTERLEKEFDNLRDREHRLVELYEESAIDLEAFRDRRAELEKQKLAVANEIAELDAKIPHGGVRAVDPDDLADRFADLQKTFPSLSFNDQRHLLRAMIDGAEVYADGRIDITLNYLAGLEQADVPVDTWREIAAGSAEQEAAG